METIIIRTTKPAKAMESISRILATTQSMKPVMQKIYVKAMKGVIALCLS